MRPLGILAALVLLVPATAPAVPFAGLEHTALGNATLTAQGGRLTVGNIGSSGLDGFSVDLGNSEAWETQWLPLVAANLPASASFTFRIFGTRNGTPDQLLWSAEMSKNAVGDVQLLPDASAIGATSSRIDVFLNGEPRASVSGVTGGVTTTEFPLGHHDHTHRGHVTVLKKGALRPDGTEEAGAPAGIALWPVPMAITIPGQPAPITGDQIWMTAEGVTSYVGAITRAEVLLRDIPSLTLTHEAAEPLVAVPAAAGWALGAGALAMLLLAARRFMRV